SRDLVRAGHQQVSREWWASRDRFDLHASRLVLEECRDGDPVAAAERLTFLDGLPLLAEDEVSEALANALLRDVPLPAKAAADALHVAIAAVNGIDYLLTWICRHLANAVLRSRIEAVCRTAGFLPPTICTPLELLELGQDDG
ncbi:MAG: type II toxin-antitoxin system VapC family toxin, partial [Planctomycetia bacterium]